MPQKNEAPVIEPTILTTDRNLVPPHCGGDLSSSAAPGDAQRGEMADPWQTSMKRAIRTRTDLLSQAGWAEQAGPSAERDFPVFVTREFASRIRPGDPHDPLLRQVLPIDAEDESVPGFVSDPVGDLNAAMSGGLIHKYSGRGLMITTGACAIHCRYCFRREFPYQEQSSRSEAYGPAIEYLRQNPSIDEVLLSGGDPWTLTDAALDRLMASLESVPHLRRVRIHTRMPIVLPKRITGELVDRLRQSRLTAWVVIHCNHSQEIDGEVADGIARLVDAGIPVLNQAVLLRGVNDDVETMAQLCRRLVDLRVMPYYLHQLDRVRGAAHFEVPVETGRSIIEGLRERLPGYAVPTYVIEQSGEASKTPL